MSFVVGRYFAPEYHVVLECHFTIELHFALECHFALELHFAPERMHNAGSGRKPDA